MTWSAPPTAAVLIACSALILVCMSASWLWAKTIFSNAVTRAFSCSMSFMVPSLRAGWVALPAYRREGASLFRRGHGVIVASAPVPRNPGFLIAGAGHG